MRLQERLRQMASFHARRPCRDGEMHVTWSDESREAAERIDELEDCIRALIETAYAPIDTRRGVIERAQRTLAK